MIDTKIDVWFGTTVLSIQLTNCTIQCNLIIYLFIAVFELIS
jgi:hypothetical protein